MYNILSIKYSQPIGDKILDGTRTLALSVRCLGELCSDVALFAQSLLDNAESSVTVSNNSPHTNNAVAVVGSSGKRSELSDAEAAIVAEEQRFIVLPSSNELSHDTTSVLMIYDFMQKAVSLKVSHSLLSNHRLFSLVG